MASSQDQPTNALLPQECHILRNILKGMREGTCGDMDEHIESEATLSVCVICDPEAICSSARKTHTGMVSYDVKCPGIAINISGNASIFSFQSASVGISGIPSAWISAMAELAGIFRAFVNGAHR